LFYHYQNTLKGLSNIELLEQTLREFELYLLSVIGYGLTLSNDLHGEPILAHKTYHLNADGLFEAVANNADKGQSRQFSGDNLISIAEKNWQDPEVLKGAKRLLRLSLQTVLGDKPLQSRKLFRRTKS
jgi:DNA repair protein RecO (recombination protein O)